MEALRNVCKVLVGKPEGRTSFGRPRRRWEDNVRMDLSEIMWEGLDWIHLAQDTDQWWTLVKKVINLQVP
jgi:hypothetical protein